MKKNILILSLGIISLASCTNNSYDPAAILSQQQIDSTTLAIAPYIVHLPSGATEATKFDPTFRDAYANKAKNIRITKYHVAEKDTIYFEIQQVARSVKFKKTATGGKLHVNASGKMDYYEEIYRTWKVDTATLNENSKIFFAAMVDNKDLSPYYTAQTNDDKHIEFPNETTQYSIEKRQWQTSLAAYKAD